MDKPLAKAWGAFEDKVVPPDAGEVQRRETERAFYSGALVVLGHLEAISRLDCTEDRAVEVLAAMQAEVKAYIDRKLGRRGGVN